MVIADRARRDAESVIRALYEITSEYEQGLEHQLRRLLALGCHRLDLDLGIVAAVADDVWRVVEVNAPVGRAVNVGDEQRASDTCCAVVLAQMEALAVESVADSVLAERTSCICSGYRVYAGVPLVVGGQAYGTLSFRGMQATHPPFTDADLDCLRLMATWVGGEIHRRQTEQALRQATSELERLTKIDPLTQLLNRRGLENSLHRLAARSARDGDQVIALLVDLDDFKSVNDVHGYAEGDESLVAVAQALQAAIRPTDLCARIGGDEFLMLLPHATVAQGVHVAERIRTMIRKDGRCRTTVSIGVAAVDPSASDIHDVVRATDSGLKASKHSGKNLVTTAQVPVLSSGE